MAEMEDNIMEVAAVEDTVAEEVKVTQAAVRPIKDSHPLHQPRTLAAPISTFLHLISSHGQAATEVSVPSLVTNTNLAISISLQSFGRITLV